MKPIFFWTAGFVFLTIFIEALILLLQLHGRRFSQWFGKRAFTVHSVILLLFWCVTFAFFVGLQSQGSSSFHHSSLLRYVGLVFFVVGLVISTWGFVVLGLRRSLCVNFFEDNVPVVKHSIYRFIQHPEDLGFWTALLGFALWTNSVPNLLLALEFIILMIPLCVLENQKK